MYIDVHCVNGINIPKCQSLMTKLHEPRCEPLRLGIGHLAELHVGQNLVDIRGLHLLSPNALDLAMDTNRNVAILSWSLGNGALIRVFIDIFLAIVKRW